MADDKRLETLENDLDFTKETVMMLKKTVDALDKTVNEALMTIDQVLRVHDIIIGALIELLDEKGVLEKDEMNKKIDSLVEQVKKQMTEQGMVAPSGPATKNNVEVTKDKG